jgi:glutamine synthetase
VEAKIGLEQELFLIPRDQFNRRPDLQLSGRTVVGRQPPRGQEMSDHYMAPPSFASPALACMQEIQHECYKVGIPLKTRHREVAPNQYEFAPSFGTVTTQVDQNLTVMQIIDEVATRHGLAALFQEKPFHGINGSGKHNNWSMADDNMNLLNFPETFAKTGSPLVFTVVMSCVLRAISAHGDLFRLGVTSPGNDFRLGACEAPPAIISTHLGNDLVSYLEKIVETKVRN